MPDLVWPHVHLTALRGLPVADLRTALRRSIQSMPAALASVGAKPAGPDSIASQSTVATMFFEDSTRTRSSFTLAAQRLGATVIDLSGSTSSVNKGESLIDTARTIEAMGVDAIVVRAKQSGAAELVSRHVQACVINAGDGKHEHPTQGLLDICTLAEAHQRLGSLDLTGLRVCIVGDVASSRVARSAIAGMTALSATVIAVGPPSLAPESLASLGCEIARDLDAELPRADAVMMLRIQFERHDAGPKPGTPGNPDAPKNAAITSIREFRDGYALTSARAQRLKPGAIVMHPGPMNRGLEIDPQVADGPRSVILRQVSWGVAVRMATLELCLNARAHQRTRSQA